VTYLRSSDGIAAAHDDRAFSKEQRGETHVREIRVLLDGKLPATRTAWTSTRTSRNAN
jgi:hypothetical protein